MAGDAKSRAPFGNGKGGGAGDRGRDTVTEPSQNGDRGYDQVADAQRAPKQDGSGYDQAAEKGKPQKTGTFRASQDIPDGGPYPFTTIDKCLSERGGKPLQPGSNQGQTLPVSPAPAWGVLHKPFTLGK